MSDKQEKELQPWQSAIQGARERFEKNSDLVSYDRESIFAMQALMKTDYAMKVANANPTSVRLAMINVASTGLTLNPANGYAYLVPRDNAIQLDISYKGLIKIATDTGAVRWARAEIVRDKDRFVFRGPAQAPEHEADAFRDRGEIIGVYCIAKTSDGDILTEIMPSDELSKIRDKSMAYAKSKSGPWVEFFEQMAKKSVIKRASKTWPYTDRGDRLSHAIEVANASEGGYEFENPVPKLEIEDVRKQRHDEACEQYAIAIDVIKGEIHAYDDDQDDAHLYTVAECWSEIPSAAQMDLWLATTKGGIFTTHERDVIKSKLPKEPSSPEDGRRYGGALGGGKALGES